LRALDGGAHALLLGDRRRVGRPRAEL
jgi:hypothetical protein